MGVWGHELRRIPTWPACAVLLVALACGPRRTRAPAAITGDEITLYRDRAVIRKRLEVDVLDADQAIVTLMVPAGVEVDDVVVLDRGELTVTQALAPRSSIEPVWKRDPRTSGEDDGDHDETDEGEKQAPSPQAAPAPPAGPTELRFVVTAPKAGRYGLSLGYVTDQMPWEVAYTMTTPPARTHVSLRGAISIRNTTGMTFTDARTFVIDGDLGSFRGRLAEQQAKEDEPVKAAPAKDKDASAPVAVPRALGMLTLGAGETRVDLLPADRPRNVRSVLVYDPIGTKLDHGGTSPIRDARLGIGAASPRVKESLEVSRPTPSNEGLPGGPVRLLERRADGTLALIGESRLFDVSTSVAAVDIVEIGTADNVSGQRERRTFSVDEDRKRLVEEFAVTIENKREQPIEVVLREHLYRSQNWSLAYYTAMDAKKDGAQQISLRIVVPAKGEAKLFYVVVYTWQ